MAIVDPFDSPAPSSGIVDPFADQEKTADPQKPLAWSDVPLEAIKNIPSSAYNMAASAAELVGKALPYAKYGPAAVPVAGYDMAKALYNNPDLVKQIPAAAWKGLVDRYGSEEAIKHSIATDPVGVAADIATLYTGGEALGARAARGISEIGKAADVSKPFYDIARPPETPPPPPPPSTPLQRLGDAGMQVDLPRAITTQNPAVRAGSVALSKVPWAGAPLDEAVRAVPAQIGSHVEDIAGQFSPKLPENVVGGGIEQTLSGAAKGEAATAQAAAEADHAARVATWEQENQAREQAITDRQAQATSAATRAFGDVHPMEAAQDTINDVQSAHRQARAQKDALYGDVNNLDARVDTSAFTGLRDRAEQALSDAGFSIDDPGSNAAKMLQEMDRLSGKPGDIPPNVPPRMLQALTKAYGDNIPAKAFDELGFPGATEAVPPDFRLTGAHAPTADAIPVQGLEQLNRRLGRMGMNAETKSDRAASSIVKGAFDDWRNDALGSHLTADSEAGAGAVIDKARAAHSDLMNRFGYNYKRLPEGEPRNAAKLLNQVVTEGVGPEALRDNLVGAKPGNRTVSAPLYEAISRAVPDAAAFRNRMRGAYWNSISGGNPASVARNVEGFTPTRMGAHLFDPREHELMRGYSELAQQTPQQLKEAARIAKQNEPKLAKLEPGASEQLAGRAIGRSEEKTLGKLDSAMRQGGNIKEVARTWGRLSEANRNELRGSWLRNLGGGGEDFSIGKFVSNWNDYSDQAKAIMLNREQRQHLNDFHQVAKDYQTNLAKYGNPSGTAQVTAWHKLLAATAKTAGGVLTGTVALAHPLGMAAIGLGARKLSSIMARPQGARDLTRWSRVAQSYKSAPSAAKLATLGNLTRSLNAAGE